MAKDYSVDIDLNDPNNSRTKLVMMCGRGKVVLDVGCACGDVAEALKQRGCRVTGIEIDQEAARKAGRVCERVLVVDLERLELSEELPDAKFDVILFGDVIEHLKSPSRVLIQARQLLAPGGFIGVSVPNIAHASMRLMILRGEFSYSDLGILDDTHLRFFTRESLCDLLNSSGYVVDSLEWTEGRISHHDLKSTLDPLGLGNLEEVMKSFSSPDAVAYQYVAKAFPASDQERMRVLSDEKERAQQEVRRLEAELNRLKDMMDSVELVNNAYGELERAYRDIELEVERRGDYIEELGKTVNDKTAAVAARESRIAELEDELIRTGDEITRIRSELLKAERKR